MEEKQLVIHANEYIKKLAIGINPLDNSIIKEEDIINDVKISRCLFFVSGILEKYIKGESYPKTKNKKETFKATKEELTSYNYDDITYISKIVNQINSLIKKDNMKKLMATNVTEWLVFKGYLSIEVNDYGTKKLPTDLGKQLGISTEVRQANDRTYLVNVYDKNAQKFIIENIEEIVKYINS